MRKILEELEQEVIAYLATVTYDNFSEKYDGLIDILLPFRNRGGKKEEVESLLITIREKIELDDYQDEVFAEVSNRLGGYCSPFHRIDW